MFKHCVNGENADDESDNVEKNEENEKKEENEKTVGNGKNEERENLEAIDEVEIVNIDEPHDIIEVEDPDEIMNDDEKQNETFVNPSQADNDASSKIIKCEMCDFKTSKSLVFQCKICGEEFEIMKDLKKHKDEKHIVNGELLLQFECDECGKRVNEKWKLVAHKKKHTSFPCDKCSKIFKFNETSLGYRLLD